MWEAGQVRVAMYDLAADCGECDVAAFKAAPINSSGPKVALCICGGETSWYQWSRVRVLAPRPDGSGEKMVKVATFDGPLLELLGVDASPY